MHTSSRPMHPLLLWLQRRAAHWHDGIDVPLPPGALASVADLVAAGIGAGIALGVVVGAAKTCWSARCHDQQQQQQQQQHPPPTAPDSHPEETLAILRFISAQSPAASKSPERATTDARNVVTDVLYVHGVLRGVGYRGDGGMIVTVGLGTCCCCCCCCPIGMCSSCCRGALRPRPQ
jgi:hypothetical protein